MEGKNKQQQLPIQQKIYNFGLNVDPKKIYSVDGDKIHRSLKLGDTDTDKDLFISLKKASDINIKVGNEQNKILHEIIASEIIDNNTKLQQINELLEKNTINILARDENGNTPIHYAIELQNFEIFNILYEKLNKNIYNQLNNNNNMNPMHYFSFGKKVITKEFLNNYYNLTDIDKQELYAIIIKYKDKPNELLNVINEIDKFNFKKEYSTTILIQNLLEIYKKTKNTNSKDVEDNFYNTILENSNENYYEIENMYYFKYEKYYYKYDFRIFNKLLEMNPSYLTSIDKNNYTPIDYFMISKNAILIKKLLNYAYIKDNLKNMFEKAHIKMINTLKKKLIIKNDIINFKEFYNNLVKSLNIEIPLLKNLTKTYILLFLKIMFFNDIDKIKLTKIIKELFIENNFNFFDINDDDIKGSILDDLLEKVELKKNDNIINQDKLKKQKEYRMDEFFEIEIKDNITIKYEKIIYNYDYINSTLSMLKDFITRVLIINNILNILIYIEVIKKYEIQDLKDPKELLNAIIKSTDIKDCQNKIIDFIKIDNNNINDLEKLIDNIIELIIGTKEQNLEQSLLDKMNIIIDKINNIILSNFVFLTEMNKLGNFNKIIIN